MSDTTAPGKVAWFPAGRMEREQLWARPVFYATVYPSLHQWAQCIALCIWHAALEEMRVRAALKRAGMDENGMINVSVRL